MKKVILSLGLFLAISSSYSQTKVVKDSSGNFKVAKAPKKASEDKATGQTFTSSKGETYPVYVSDNGKYYVIRTSKSGNQYRQYLSVEESTNP